MKRQLIHIFDEIVSVENLLKAWKEFVPGKRNKCDLNKFSFQLMDNIMSLHDDLARFTYVHGDYHAFNISDPKPRNIHKACMRDRLLHHAVYRILYPFIDAVFIADSFSCREGKGTHKALDRFRAFYRRASANGRKTCWVLKCDIRKFFASVDHKFLIAILQQYIKDTQAIWLLQQITSSFSSTRPGVGLPLGNLTSQLLVNIYMNEFDQFVKHQLKAKYYIRYADDFVLLSANREELEQALIKIKIFLQTRLKLDLHRDKVYITTVVSGVDFLGWIHRDNHRILRQATKRRMFTRLAKQQSNERSQSYLGLIKHGNTRKIKKIVLEDIFFS